ncbi:MAG: zf-HC2 domain-containing protein [Gemmatimonadales bacterium]
MMGCHDVLDRLWDFLDAEVGPAEEAAIRRHLELCSRCYPQYVFRRAQLDLMRRVRDRVTMPPASRRALLLRILEQDRAGTPKGQV